MTLSDKKLLLNLARRSIQCSVKGIAAPEIPSDEVCQQPGGAFVTLKISNMLRGCIGSFAGLGTLGKTVIAMARQAALGDPRFMPVSVDEVEKISIEISVLSPMKPIKEEDVVPGRHGLYIRRGSRAGTLLPQVALEEGWDRVTFLSHTCLKAGLHREAYMEKGTEIFAYTAEVFGEKSTGKEELL